MYMYMYGYYLIVLMTIIIMVHKSYHNKANDFLVKTFHNKTIDL